MVRALYRCALPLVCAAFVVVSYAYGTRSRGGAIAALSRRRQRRIDMLIDAGYSVRQARQMTGNSDQRKLDAGGVL